MKPLLVSSVLLDAGAFGSFVLSLDWLTTALFLVAGVRHVHFGLYILKDIRLRGSSPLWTLVPGFGLIVWLIWRRSHPILT